MFHCLLEYQENNMKFKKFYEKNNYFGKLNEMQSNRIRIKNLNNKIMEKNNYEKIPFYNYKIYCDLYGVLVNLKKGIEELDEFKKSGAKNACDFINNYTKLAWKTIDSKGSYFWANLEWMPDGKKLWRFIKKIGSKR